MAISKSKLEGDLTREQKYQLSVLEAQIDRQLRRKYSPGEDVFVQIREYVSGRVRNAIENKYREKGWKVGWHRPEVLEAGEGFLFS